MASPDSQNLPTQGVRKLDIYTQLYEALFGGCQRPPGKEMLALGSQPELSNVEGLRDRGGHQQHPLPSQPSSASRKA